MTKRASPLLLCLPAILTLIAMPACESDQAQRPDHGSASAPAAPAKPLLEMEAHGTFFAGKIKVETLLNSTGFAERESGGSGGNDSTGGSGGAHFGGHRGNGGTGESSDTGTGAAGAPVPHMRVSNLPPVRLHLRLTNLGSMPVEVEVPDFDSDLGDFVVEPSTFFLAPKESAEAEPMTSTLGVTSNSIPLTISLAAGGRTETQVLVLKTVTPPAPSKN